MTNPFEDPAGTYLVLVNAENQHATVLAHGDGDLLIELPRRRVSAPASSR